MDFDLDEDQAALLARVDSAVTESGHTRALGVSAVGGYDAELDAKLYETVHSALAPSLLDRALVADRLAELGTATTLAAALALGLVAPDLPVDRPVTVVGRTGLARFGAQARLAVTGEGDEVRVVDLESAPVEPVRSGFVYPYARVDARGARTVARVPADAWSQAITVVRCAEVAGVGAAAVARTADHLKNRTQFGRPLATLQALRHRLAELAVSAEATRWLTREAAYTRTPRAVAVAAQYAHQTAATLVPELVQIGGARSFAHEFGLHVNAFRLEALRLELGPPDALARALNATPVPAGTRNGR
ncbi:acyl-CoA dehydrogenase family protein [Jatrophihabitans fulvus]